MQGKEVYGLSIGRSDLSPSWSAWISWANGSVPMVYYSMFKVKH